MTLEILVGIIALALVGTLIINIVTIVVMMRMMKPYKKLMKLGVRLSMSQVDEDLLEDEQVEIVREIKALF